MLVVMLNLGGHELVIDFNVRNLDTDSFLRPVANLLKDFADGAWDQATVRVAVRNLLVIN